MNINLRSLRIKYLFFLWSISNSIFAQIIIPALDKDTVFRQVLLKRIEYPRYTMRNFPLYGRVYIGFQVDEKGRITNITVLSPGNTQSGFENEVIRSLKHMTSLNPSYYGEYALPVAFCYLNRSQSPKVYCPINRIDSNRLKNRILLKEFNCTLDFQPYKGSFSEPREVWGYYLNE